MNSEWFNKSDVTGDGIFNTLDLIWYLCFAVVCYKLTKSVLAYLHNTFNFWWMPDREKYMENWKK